VIKEVMETVEEMAERIYGPRSKSEPKMEKRHKLTKSHAHDTGNERSS